MSAHGIGGMVGALLTGILAERSWNGTADGALFGNLSQLAVQFAAVAATIVYSVVGTLVILKLVALVSPLRASEKEEGMGMDLTQHGEEAYSRGEGAILVHADRGGR